MKNIAIICEYNPFHNGHKLQIEYIRSVFPEPVRVICLMSGNFVERGDIACADKYKRAEFAILGGADLVLGLPFPYSLSGAQEYAYKNIEYLNFLPEIGYLCFGSESGDLRSLEAAAKRLCSEEFNSAMADTARSEFSLSYASLRSSLYYEIYGEKLPSTPNDILALEYLSALKKSGSKIRPLIIKREAPFSAGGARNAIAAKKDFESMLPEYAAGYFKKDPALSINDLEDFIIPSLSLSDPEEISAFRGMNAELASKLIKSARECGNILELENALSDKRYTRARVRRAILSSALRIDGRMTPPPYSLLLGANSRGREYLSGYGREITGVYSKRSEIKDRLILASFDREAAADRIYRYIQRKKGIEPSVSPFIFL